MGTARDDNVSGYKYYRDCSNFLTYSRLARITLIIIIIIITSFFFL